MPCIYKIQNKSNNKVYIGQTMSTLDWRLNGRWIGHFYMAFEKNSSMRIHRALRKYGKDGFTYEVIEEKYDGTFEEQHKWLNEREKHWIKKYDSMNPVRGYNSTSGGTGNFSVHKKLSDELKAQRRSSMKLRQTSTSYRRWINNGVITKQVHFREVDSYVSSGWSLGRLPMNRIASPRIWTEEEKQAQSKRLTGTKKPDSFKQFIAERNKQPWMREKVSKANSGKVMSDEARKHMSEAKFGRKASEEEKSKRRMTRAKNEQEKGKKVWINNNVITKWVYEVELDDYLKNDWQLGRLKMKKHKTTRKKTELTEEQKAARSMRARLAQLGKKHIHKDGIIKYVDKSQLDTYLSNGWLLGRGSKKDEQTV